MKIIDILFVGIIIACISQPTHSLPMLWPEPHSLSLNVSAVPLLVSPCDINYVIQSALAPYIQTIIDTYLANVFKCSTKKESNISLYISVSSRSVNLPLEIHQDWYSLIIRQSTIW